MQLFHTLMAVFAAIALFLFSLQGFSKELRSHGVSSLKAWLDRITAYRLGGFLFGATLTAVVQSSSLVTSVVVTFVDAQVVSFFNSLSIMVGANVGTTMTAWLVVFKLNNLGNWLLVLGFLMGLSTNTRVHVSGRIIFYLGLILFSLRLLNEILAPIGSNPQAVEWLAKANYIPLGILAGMVFTAIIQSSSVTTGLIIILSSQGMIDLNGALALVLGSNIGTTSTGLLASISLSKAARSAAIFNLFFNITGLLLFLPFFWVFRNFIAGLALEMPTKVATAHLLFNVITACLALPLLRPLSRLVLWIAPIPNGKDMKALHYDESAPDQPV